jgi:hypothetical protein
LLPAGLKKRKILIKHWRMLKEHLLKLIATGSKIILE